MQAEKLVMESKDDLLFALLENPCLSHLLTGELCEQQTTKVG